MSTQKASVKKAFTLTELLVSMAVIGLIATLTLPHMFMSVDRAKKRAVFKEAYKALAEAVHTTMLEGGTSYDVIKKLNPKKICQTNSFKEGCTQYSLGVDVAEPGVLLSTGVSITGLSSITPIFNGIMIGLEDFPKKEYFYIMSNYGEAPFDATDFLSGKDGYTGYPLKLAVSPLIVRSGEIKCVEQACLDMLKND